MDGSIWQILVCCRIASLSLSSATLKYGHRITTSTSSELHEILMNLRSSGGRRWRRCLRRKQLYLCDCDIPPPTPRLYFPVANERINRERDQHEIFPHNYLPRTLMLRNGAKKNGRHIQEEGRDYIESMSVGVG